MNEWVSDSSLIFITAIHIHISSFPMICLPFLNIIECCSVTRFVTSSEVAAMSACLRPHHWVRKKNEMITNNDKKIVRPWGRNRNIKNGFPERCGQNGVLKIEKFEREFGKEERERERGCRQKNVQKKRISLAIQVRRNARAQPKHGIHGNSDVGTGESSWGWTIWQKEGFRRAEEGRGEQHGFWMRKPWNYISGIRF